MSARGRPVRGEAVSLRGSAAGGCRVGGPPDPRLLTPVVRVGGGMENAMTVNTKNNTNGNDGMITAVNNTAC